MRPLLRGIGKTFVAIGAVALATAGYVWVTLPMCGRSNRRIRRRRPSCACARPKPSAGKPVQFSSSG